MLCDSVAIVIPSYNMDWCLERAVKSCQGQSITVSEIIIVDDCSSDDTTAVVMRLAACDARIRYIRLTKNGGHLAALRCGAQEAASDWVVLLDADDELTPNSIEARLLAADKYRQATGVKAQLIYGDLEGGKFTRLRGYAFTYLCKELCLCQTSTIMLGRECISHIPIEAGHNTDDELVLSIGRHFHVLHSGTVVAICHTHNSPTKMGNNARKCFEGVWDLVRAHRSDIMREHGVGRLFLWWLRTLKAFLRYQIIVANQQITASEQRLLRLLFRIYRRALSYIEAALKSFLRLYFDSDYF
jgi:glycosyltransferase involved in cell wall biosynthesis